MVRLETKLFRLSFTKSLPTFIFAKRFGVKWYSAKADANIRFVLDSDYIPSARATGLSTVRNGESA